MTMQIAINGQLVDLSPEEEAAFRAEQLASLPAVTLDDYKAAFDAHLDAVAQSKLYDNRVTIATYSGSSSPQWAAEASAFIGWRDAAMLSMFAQLEAFEGGGPQPSIADFLAGLPAIVWPVA